MKMFPARTQRFALAAAAIFAFAAGYDLWHVVSISRFGGTLSLPVSVVLAIVNGVVWGSAAVLLALRDRVGTGLGLQASFATSAIGAFLLFVHGLVLRGTLGEPIGIAFILGGIAAAILVKLAWTPFPWSQHEPPARGASHRTVRDAAGEEHPVL